MNEQLIVKSFGPIKGATVDFKKVTVFIGPTGGGKSTLAKLAAVFRSQIKYHGPIDPNNLSSFNIRNYWQDKSRITWKTKQYAINKTHNRYNDLIELLSIDNENKDIIMWIDESLETLRNKIISNIEKNKNERFRLNYLLNNNEREDYLSEVESNLINDLREFTSVQEINYLPAERVFLPALEYSWAGNVWNEIGLPKFIKYFANKFTKAREIVKLLSIEFLGVVYQFKDKQDYIKLNNSEDLFRLYETASGIQSVVPLLVLLEYLSISNKQAQSFIIEEPELNLYPTAQQELLSWLVSKCTVAENDLMITTHSPYILSHLNLLLYAFQVAEKHPDRADDVAKIVPRESWINPKEFACYHVEGQKENGIYSIVNPETGLISYNDLDALAGNSATEFDRLLDINAGLEVE